MKNIQQDKGKENKGIKIVKMGNLKKIDDAHYLVHSQSNLGVFYRVIWNKNNWVCDCPDFEKHQNKCKHVHAVNYYLTLTEIKSGVENLKKEAGCPICGLEVSVVRDGMRYNRSGQVQRYLCQRCRKRFTERTTGFKGMKIKANIVASALDLYFRGLSLRKIVQHLESSYSIKISHGTVYYWIKKYVDIISSCTGELNAKFSDRWHADETILKVNGRHFLLWSLLDSETRYLIATHISQKRGEDEASALLRKGKNRSEEKPLEIVTDGLASYDNAIKKELGSDPTNPMIHLQGSLAVGLNNKMERLNGTIKSRTKTMSGFRNEESTQRFINGFSIYYNFIKPHTALDGMTPAMIAGVMTEKCNWLDLIIQSKKSREHDGKVED